MSVFFKNAFAIDSTIWPGNSMPFWIMDKLALHRVLFVKIIQFPFWHMSFNQFTTHSLRKQNETTMGKLPIQHGGIMMISMNISSRSFIFVTNYSYFIYFSEAYT
uniref:Uncharacterized protein n=1 Tax=Lactuca sativa TaxID=4236 RepID=A0A9R1UK40_LACSA|nr:hypothetical protein LSAT_V11C900484020 [Lactuca sativa]